jgi:Type II secretion system (T2SS), protein N
MSRLWYIVIAVVTFVALLVFLAPASLVKKALESIPGITFSDVRGTLWSGSGQLAANGHSLGQLTYRFKPIELVLLRAAYDAHLQSESVDLSATVSATLNAALADLHGRLDAAALRELLQRYDMVIGGAFETQGLNVVQRWNAALPNVKGELRWSGAPVSYRLGNVTHRTVLPPLSGFIDSRAGKPEMTAYEADHDTPLMFARVAEDGWVTIGITKRFTQLLGQPWTGSDADHAVVLEVQEQLF